MMIWLALVVGFLLGALAGMLGTDWWHHQQSRWVDLEAGEIRIRRHALIFKSRKITADN